MSIYNKNFYLDRDTRTNYAAEKILSMVFERYKVDSVVDFGCGVGTWLKNAEKLGATNTTGLEGDWLDQKMFVANGELLRKDFEKPVNLQRQYDLAISLEVAEHINETNIDQFIDGICSSSDVILFSAAVAGQGGKGHVNEQMQSYWVTMFNDRGYHCIDIIRKSMWGDSNIDVWYKQNVFIFSKKTEDKNFSSDMPLDVIHPELFKLYSRPGVLLSVKTALSLPKVVANKILK